MKTILELYLNEVYSSIPNKRKVEVVKKTVDGLEQLSRLSKNQGESRRKHDESVRMRDRLSKKPIKTDRDKKAIEMLNRYVHKHSKGMVAPINPSESLPDNIEKNELDIRRRKEQDKERERRINERRKEIEQRRKQREKEREDRFKNIQKNRNTI